ncbi:hypothetical protein EDD37DRAFT_656416 [Exophiala viscosa]|uniref:uncharacterized protein n=1 Tax=Exophiala viscosa TaxID=2486360 RepID=UPI0021940A97|nr:hypothetical protein EDD37DRAFT_656416 [Exophiala viscosa]
MPQKTVLVTGANGFIGYGVCRAFSLAGWTTYGMLRSDKSIPDLIKEEIIPIVGTAANPTIPQQLPPIDVVVCCSGDPSNFKAHFEDITSMSQRLSQIAREKGHDKPLVIVTSGCKDYGTTLRHGDPDLAPHTESSPLNYPPILAERCDGALKMLKFTDDFDCVITRPTTLYGRSSSYYSYIFHLAEQAKARSDGVMKIASTPNSILHGTHVDDVGAAYVAIAEAPRHVVAGQAYNMSSHRYETLGELVPAIEQSHGVKVEYVDPEENAEIAYTIQILFNFPQWVGSDKLRRDTGWTDKKPLFHKGYEVYRRAYDAAANAKSEQYERVMAMAVGQFGVQQS